MQNRGMHTGCLGLHADMHFNNELI